VGISISRASFLITDAGTLRHAPKNGVRLFRGDLLRGDGDLREEDRDGDLREEDRDGVLLRELDRFRLGGILLDKVFIFNFVTL